jgi:DNA-binding IclR family transcriptional regulator
MVNTGDTSQKWAALAKQNERLVDASHPLLAELRRDHPETSRRLPAAS